MSSEEERINNLINEVRVLEGTFNDLSSRQSLLERILIESRSSLDTIKGLDTSSSDEVLIPVGAGVLIRAVPPKIERVLVNIGANVVVEKSKEDATKIMDDRANQVEQDIVAIASQRSQIAQRLEADRRVLQSFINRQQQLQQQQQQPQQQPTQRSQLPLEPGP